MNKNQYGANNPSWKGGKSEFTCGECGKKFYDYHRKRADRKFCSKECEAKNRDNRVIVKCEECGKELKTSIWYLEHGEGKFCSLSCSAKWYRGKRGKSYGKKQTDEHIQKRVESISGEKHYNWKQGKKKHRDGYFLIRIKPGHYRLEHRIIAEKVLGRPLRAKEVVHHINGNKTDNRNENLLICTRSYHSWLHRRMSNFYQQEHFAAA